MLAGQAFMLDKRAIKPRILKPGGLTRRASFLAKWGSLENRTRNIILIYIRVSPKPRFWSHMAPWSQTSIYTINIQDLLKFWHEVNWCHVRCQNMRTSKGMLRYRNRIHKNKITYSKLQKNKYRRIIVNLVVQCNVIYFGASKLGRKSTIIVLVWNTI
jgi:hypothetical protein